MNYMNEEKNKIIYYSNNTCVSCGSSIPEGQMVCQYCLNQENQKESKKLKKMTNHLKCKNNFEIKTDEDYNIYVLATSNDIDDLIRMKKGILPNPRGYSKTELSKAIELYYTEEFINIREETLKDNIIATYEATVIIDDFGDSYSQYFPYGEIKIDDYLKGFSTARIRIKEIKSLVEIEKKKF